MNKEKTPQACDQYLPELLSLINQKKGSPPLDVKKFLHQNRDHYIFSSNRIKEIKKALFDLKKLYSNYSILTFHKNSLPKLLKTIPDPPVCLFTLGEKKLLKSPMISVVGSRNSTQEGQSKVHSLCKYFSDKDLVLVSGIARGIDSSLHECAINHKIKTIGVLPHGLGFPNSKQSENLIKKILSNGGLVITEFLPFEATKKSYFEFRNRIIAALGKSTFIIEAQKRSGTFITARHCERYDRKIYLPLLSERNPNLEGLELLLERHPNASLYRSIEELFRGPENAIYNPLSSVGAMQQLSKNALKIIEKLKITPLNYESLSQGVSLNENELKNTLIELLAKEVIHESNGQWFFLIER